MPGSITVWWGIPCKSVLPIFRHLHDTIGRDLRFVSLYPMPEHRVKLGWVIPPTGALPIEVLDEESWRRRADELIEERHGLHLINGIYHNQRIRYVADRLRAQSRRYGVIVEAPSNLEVGWRRAAKLVLAPIITPFRAWRVARAAEFVLSQSGDVKAPFRRLGFRKDRIFPFGYFPDFAPVPRGAVADDHMSLLSIGYLEPFKGQDTLLKAIDLLRRRGLKVSATITGFGSARERLISLRQELGLSDCVEFVGVVDDERLMQLFAKSSALVAPGFEEPWGIRVNEGLLALLPVVVSDGVGAKELVLATGGGEVFSAGSPQSLARALVRLANRLTLGHVQRALAAGRDRITPKAAAIYLDKVITLADRGFVAGLPPDPPWLCAPDECWAGRGCGGGA